MRKWRAATWRVEAVIAGASKQSNFCRQTAASAAKLGMKAILVLMGDPNTEIQGNLLVDDLADDLRSKGVKVQALTVLNAWAPSPTRTACWSSRLDARKWASEGIHYMIVNGEVVVLRNAHTGALPGGVLRLHA